MSQLFPVRKTELIVEQEQLGQLFYSHDNLMINLRAHRELIRVLASKPITPATVMSLRKLLGETTARALLEIASIQAKAINKFGDGVWMGTARATEQASDQVVANYKAMLMGERTVADLCGGIGGDAMGFARRGPVITIDRDPQMTRMAAENLRSIQAQSAVTVCAEATTYFSKQSFSDHQLGFHIDPDRRPGDRRTTEPAAYEPSFEFVSSVIRTASASIVKLAPAAELDDITSANHHRQWISLAGTVREQALLSGDCINLAAVKAGTRSAVKLLRDGSRQCFAPMTSDANKLSVVTAPLPLSYIIDFDPAVRAAGLSAALATERSLYCLGDPSGFFTGDNKPIDRSLMQCFEVIWSGPADIKQIRKQIVMSGLRITTIKVRGTDHEPTSLLKSLNQPKHFDGQDAILLMGRNGAVVYAAIAIRL